MQKAKRNTGVGAGGMGVVVAATHLDLDRPVAVKLIRQELAEDPAIVERLMLEARAAAKIKSDHVGKVLDVGKLPNGAPYIVMELLEGLDLCQLLEKNGALPIMDAVDALLQACEAIAEAHQAHIVHRDLKPENLYLTRRTDGTPCIKVLDFGLSKVASTPQQRERALTATTQGSNNSVRLKKRARWLWSSVWRHDSTTNSGITTVTIVSPRAAR